MRYCLMILFISLWVRSGAQQADFILSGVYQWDKLRIETDEVRMNHVLGGKTFALEHLDINLLSIPAGAVLPPYNAMGLEVLLIMKEGDLKMIMTGKTDVLNKGDVAFIMEGDQFELQNLGTGTATLYILKYKSMHPDRQRATSEGGSFMLNWDELAINNTGKGYRRNFFDRATSHLKQFEMHTTALNADSSSHAPHTHIQEEIVLILRGKVEMQIGDKFYKAAPGDLYFLASNIPHTLKNIGGEQCEYFTFQWRN